MQYYLTNKLLNSHEPAPKVVSVKEIDNSSAYGAIRDIEIELEGGGED